MRFLFLLLLPLVLFASSVTYKVKLGFFPAGQIKITFLKNRVEARGKSGGFIGLFYKYSFLMVYNIENPSLSFLKEEENGKRRFFEYRKLLKKKAWLPMVVKLLLERERIAKLKKFRVGDYEIILLFHKGEIYTFKVLGSKRTKSITLKGWKESNFPEEIEIETSAGTLKLERK